MKPLLDDEHGDELGDRTDPVPLIDCVFLVLLFYVVASTFAEESAFPVQLPRVNDAAQVSEVATAAETLTVWISAEGAFAVGKVPVAPLDLGRVLREQVSAAKPRTLIIRGDRRAPHEKVAAALEVAQALGVPELSLVVDRSDTPQTPR